jgi:predicted amidohydrolase YtcJ
MPLALFLLFALAASAQTRVDLIIYGGNILVMDSAFRTATVAVIDKGKIVAVGGSELEAKYTADQRIDLKGRTALPGFNDSHTHIKTGDKRSIGLTDARSIQEVKAAVRAKAAELGPGEWIGGGDWSEDKFEERRVLTRKDLDEAAPQNPVALIRAGGHSMVANSRALALAGIDRTTPQPEGGEIVKDASGELTGMIRERWRMVYRLLPQAEGAERRDALRRALQKQFSYGITSLIHANATPEEWEVWKAVYAEHRDLPRAAVQILWTSTEAIRKLGVTSGDGDERLRVGAAKVFIDGGFTGRAAYTRQPYEGESSYRGTLTRKEEELASILQQAHSMGWQLGLHTIGDAAIEFTVETLSRLLEQAPRPDHRHYLNHFTMMPSPSTLEKMRRNHIMVSQQPNFLYTLEPRYLEYIGAKRTATSVPVRTLLDRGIPVAFSSDILPVGPMIGLYVATTRRGVSGVVHGPSERISMLEALRAYTSAGAALTREEKIKGTLEPGMLADIVVLSRNPLTAKPDELLRMQADLVLLGGRVVFDRVAAPGK